MNAPAWRFPGPVLLAAVLCLSCKLVVEDRRECPCSLAVELRAVPAFPAQLYLDGMAVGEVRRDTTLRVQVEKGPVALVSALAGAVPSEDGMVRIPLGSEAPPLYAGTLRADCSADTARVRLPLYRQHCFLQLQVNAPPGWGTPYSVEVRGGVDGWSLLDGSPTRGPFHCSALAGLSCRLPRQGPEDPLWLDIAMQDRILRSFPLGDLLRQAGYAWDAPDLPDIPLQLELSVTAVRFLLPGWEAVEPLEIAL